MKQFQDAGTLQRAFFLLLFPDGRFGQEGTDDEQRNGWKYAPQNRVSPGLVATVNGGKQGTNRQAQVTRAAHHNSASRSKHLREAENRFPLFSFRKQPGEPGSHRDEFHRYTDKREAPINQQLQSGRRITRGQSGKAEQQNTPEQNAASAEAVDPVSPEQAEYSPGDGGNVEHQSDPLIELRATRPL